MKITLNSIEGKTSKKGAKQNKEYTTISEGKKYTEGSNTTFYKAIDDKNNPFCLIVFDDLSKVGIYRTDRPMRVTYCTEFNITPA